MIFIIDSLRLRFRCPGSRRFTNTQKRVENVFSFTGPFFTFFCVFVAKKVFSFDGGINTLQNDHFYLWFGKFYLDGRTDELIRVRLGNLSVPPGK